MEALSKEGYTFSTYQDILRGLPLKCLVNLKAQYFFTLFFRIVQYNKFLEYFSQVTQTTTEYTFPLLTITCLEECQGSVDCLLLLPFLICACLPIFHKTRHVANQFFLSFFFFFKCYLHIKQSGILGSFEIN